MASLKADYLCKLFGILLYRLSLFPNLFIYLFNYLFILVWTHFILWTIIYIYTLGDNLLLLYFVAQIVPALAPFSWLLCPLDILPLAYFLFLCVYIL